MINFESTRRVPSSKFAGVVIVVRTLLEDTRIQLSMQTAHLHHQIDDMRRQFGELMRRVVPIVEAAQQDETKMDAANRHPDVIQAAALQRQIDAIERDQINPAYVHAMVIAVEGATIDGKLIDQSNVLRVHPDLAAEMVAACKAELGLTGEEQKNSESLSTSPAAVDGTTSSTTAGNAGSGDTTTSVTATKSSRKK